MNEPITWAGYFTYKVLTGALSLVLAVLVYLCIRAHHWWTWERPRRQKLEKEEHERRDAGVWP